ncbi:polysaccharide deacetylase family protein [uncultured Acetobacteroides sp.]|uniref:polysaccharide deacetylase family protein n=1 Tax=uncultured Acetobacteroides sp. TaxID=1760811 RepID=UPI0029F542B2|nr:polysaccharide deacetylase family protein [uncultured Acetobacteroides sp.]
MNVRLTTIGVVLLGIAACCIGCDAHRQQQAVAAGRSTAAATSHKSSATNQHKNSAAQILSKPEVPVLCYHRIADNRKGDYTVAVATFEAHVKALADSGYHSISPAQLYAYLVYNSPLPQKPVMITFDDSREEHTAVAAPILERYGFRGVFFIMTITYNKKNYMTKAQIAQLAKRGHTIGLHSWDHTMATKYKEESDWQKQVAKPKDVLEKVAGIPVEYWAYPNGVYNHHSAEVLSRYFKLSFTLISKRDTLLPLQSVRRIIAPECSPQRLLRQMRQTFKQTN